MKAVILAGGFGTRISEESHLRPKPMVEIGERPILWHIMKIYSNYGINDFIICAGYKQHIIKEYFSNYALYNSDISFDFRTGEMTTTQNSSEPWRVTIADTGLNTMTGGRVKRIERYLEGDETFCLTYGDGVSDVDIDELLRFHSKEGKIATLTAVHPEGRFGIMDMNGDDVTSFREKNQNDVGWVNGGFMAMDIGVMDYISGDDTVLERTTMDALAADGQLNAYKHHGYWQCMDTLRDKENLQRLWNSGNAPWKTW